jgi:hypothetical protein
MINQITLVGFLGRDAQKKALPNGTPVLNSALRPKRSGRTATTNGKNARNGTKSFVLVTAWPSWRNASWKTHSSTCRANSPPAIASAPSMCRTATPSSKPLSNNSKSKSRPTLSVSWIVDPAATEMTLHQTRRPPRGFRPASGPFLKVSLREFKHIAAIRLLVFYRFESLLRRSASACCPVHRSLASRLNCTPHSLRP